MQESINSLFSLLKEGNIDGFKDHLRNMFSCEELDDNERHFTVFREECKKLFSKKNHTTCQEIKNVLQKINTKFSEFTSNRFAKCFIRTLVEHVNSGCRNGCYTAVHSAAFNAGIFSN